MDSSRPAAPIGVDAAEIIAQRAAALHLAGRYGRAEFVWPTHSYPAFYWFAVEAIVSTHPDDSDLPPALVVKDGRERTERDARRAAWHAFDESRTTHLLARAGRVVRPARVQPQHANAQPGIRASAAFRLACVGVLLGLTVGLAVHL